MLAGFPGKLMFRQNSGHMNFIGGGEGAPVTEDQMGVKQEWAERAPVGTVGPAPQGALKRSQPSEGPALGEMPSLRPGSPTFPAVLSCWLLVSGRTGRV